MSNRYLRDLVCDIVSSSGKLANCNQLKIFVITYKRYFNKNLKNMECKKHKCFLCVHSKIYIVLGVISAGPHSNIVGEANAHK